MHVWDGREMKSCNTIIASVLRTARKKYELKGGDANTCHRGIQELWLGKRSACWWQAGSGWRWHIADPQRGTREEYQWREWVQSTPTLRMKMNRVENWRSPKFFSSQTPQKNSSNFVKMSKIIKYDAMEQKKAPDKLQSINSKMREIKPS